MSYPSKIKSKPYRNWVRGALGLFYLQRGLYPFTDRVVKAEHANIVQYLTPCTNCAIENILPEHAAGKVCIQKNKARCNCKKNTNTNCPTCGKIYDDIVLQHRFREPQWVTDCSTWYNDHWQFAKCFLTTTSKGSNNTAADTDASGLLSIIINGLFFQSEIQCNIDPPNDSFSQVRKIRNEILHNSTLDLTDHDVARYLQSMIAVLEDKKTLSLDPAAQAAAIKLKEILNDELNITTNEEANAIQAALNAIKVAKEQSEECIRKLAENKQNDIKTSEESIRNLADEKQNAIKASEEGIRRLAEEKQNEIKTSEKNIKEITEESRNALQQLTSDAAQKIKTAEEESIKRVASTVSEVFKETYEREIKQLNLGHDDHEKRIRSVEAEQQNLQMKQLELEKQVAKLTSIEKKHQARIDYLKHKQGLQQYLVDVYLNHYVKTSISPLMTQQNDINIGDVYVSPRMEENKDGNEGNISKGGKDNETNNKRIERYRDIFSTRGKRNRKIFILGDVGTGKSSFCKMMMQNWCTAIIKRENIDDSSVMDEDDAKEEEEGNMCDMNQFDFLFYIPLREMSGYIADTVDMIKAQLEDYKVLIDDIFTNDSERILILADGLDEWTPPRLDRPPSLPHVTVGIPTSRSVRDSTIITTSRPSSRGILNVQSSEYDLKVTLMGLDYTSVTTMIEKYMKLLSRPSAVSEFEEKLSNLKLKDIQNAPLLLQQIIWLYCNNYNIGQSRSFIYLNIVNIILGWGYERTGGDPKSHEFQNSDLEHLQLPKCFDQFARCQENRKLLLLLGRLAYDAYVTSSDSSLVFGRYKLKQLGVSDCDISVILRSGILTEVNSADPTYEKSRLSFIHTSYLEFFAALYICSYYLSKLADAHSPGTSLHILEGLIAVTPEPSATEILRLENVLIMMCGLVPCLTEHIYEYIHKVSMSDNTDNTNNSVVYRTQKLMFDCLSEHNSIHKEAVKLRHLCVSDDTVEEMLDMLFRCIVPTSIETYSIDHFYRSELSHEKCSKLSSFLSQAVSLRTLKIKRIECTKDECEGHIIDLTNHRNLQSIELLKSEISISGINPTCLESCKISNCKLLHEQYSLLTSCLSQAASLRTLEMKSIECTKDECGGHFFDLTDHRKLQSLKLLGHTRVVGRTICNKISVSGINPTFLESCKISNCNLSHEKYSLLTSRFSQAASLRTLEMKSIKCTKDECEGHCFDLTDHRKLQSLDLSGRRSLFLSKICGNIAVSGINPTCLESCKISHCKLTHEQCTSLSSCLSQAAALQSLKLSELKCTKTEFQRDCIDCHNVDLRNHNRLKELHVSNCNMISIIGVNPTCLEKCDISNRKLSHEQCTSLCTLLSHADSLSYLNLCEIKCIEDTCACHVIDLTNHKQLWYLSLSSCNMISITGTNPTCLMSKCRIKNCSLSHEQCTSLCTFLSHAESLGSLTLREIKCIEDACAVHVIDLTKLKQLYDLSISKCYMITITDTNPICLKQCEISNCNLSHEQCSSLCTLLSHADFLSDLNLFEIKCIEDACAGHVIDLSNQQKLWYLSISKCYMISITSTKPTCLKQCDITNCNLSHEQCSSLCTLLSHADHLSYLNLFEIKCIEDACAGHVIDLTNHKQLWSLSISNCNMISLTGINPTCVLHQTL